MNSYDYILKGAGSFVIKGLERTKHIKMPTNYAFSESLMYEVGICESEQRLNELIEHCNHIAIGLNNL